MLMTQYRADALALNRPVSDSVGLEARNWTGAGTVGGTAGLTTGTVQGSTQENYGLRSDDRDREASFEVSSGTTTGTHIFYQVGSVVEITRNDRDVGTDRALAG